MKSPSQLLLLPLLTKSATANDGCKAICNIDFCDGGRFISNQSQISEDEMLPAVLELFASLVEYKNNFKFTKFDHKVYKALPSYFVHIANGSRPDSGFRLLRRCTRHSMDTQVHNIQETRGTLFQNESGTIGMSMNNLVPASTKQNKYDVSAAFSSDELMTCQCNCKCGGEGDQKLSVYIFCH